MAQYKVTANAIGTWAQGQVITDEDLKANPQFGGVERLRDQLKAIENHEPAPVRPAPANVRTTAAEGDGPNAGKGERSGKS